MSWKIIKAISFKIKNMFEEWVKFFDSKEYDLRYSKFDIKPLLKGFSIDYPKKVICIHKSPEGNIQKLFQANCEWIKSYRVSFLIMEELSQI